MFLKRKCKSWKFSFSFFVPPGSWVLFRVLPEIGHTSSSSRVWKRKVLLSIQKKSFKELHLKNGVWTASEHSQRSVIRLQKRNWPPTKISHKNIGGFMCLMIVSMTFFKNKNIDFANTDFSCLKHSNIIFTGNLNNRYLMYFLVLYQLVYNFSLQSPSPKKC